MKSSALSRLVLTIVGALLSLAFLAPILILLNNSFKTKKGFFANTLGLPLPPYFTTSNYPDAMERMNYGTALVNSLLITLTSTLIILIFTSMAAWVLVRYKTRFSGFAFMLFAAAMLIPFQCVMLPLVRLMSNLGLQNPPGLVFMYLGFGSSLSIILFHGFIKGIPLELEEAATIDGCGPTRTFWGIVFPLLRPIVATVSVLNVMWVWNDFLLPQLMINKPEWQTLPLRTYLFFGQFSKQWDLATAALIMGMIPIILFYLGAQKYIIKGIAEGAIK